MASIGTGQKHTEHRPLVCLWILDENIPDIPRWFDAVDTTRRNDGRIPSEDFLVIARRPAGPGESPKGGS